MSSQHTGEVETNEKKKMNEYTFLLLYKSTPVPTFKLAVILLKICFPFSWISLSSLIFSSFSLFFLIFFVAQKTFFSSLLVSLINVQLICMMARNNIFLWLNIPATGQTMKAIPISTQEWVGEGTKSFTIVGGRRKIQNFFLPLRYPQQRRRPERTLEAHKTFSFSDVYFKNYTGLSLFSRATNFFILRHP